MRPKRVDCGNCINFLSPNWKTSFNIIKLTTNEKAKCSLGKRVMFRVPIKAYSQMAQDCGGWWRYCNEFKQKEL